MLKRALKTLLLLPIAVLVIVLAVANRHAVVLSLDPFTPENPAFAVAVPLFWALFGMLFLGILLGGLGAWFRQSKWRRTAREKRREAENLRREAERLKETAQAQGPHTPGLPPPGSQRAA